MPTIANRRTTTPNPDAAKRDPKEIQTIRRSIESREQGPTSKGAASFVDWNSLFDDLGQPYDLEIIPINKLRQMRLDPMIAFGLHYIKTPLVRAQWRIKADDAQVAAFIDYALRPIYARLVFQYCMSLDFGFSGIAKRFQYEQPQSTYIDPQDPEGNPKPIWSGGNVDAITWKPFVALPPENVRPAWDKKTGEFNGIIFQNASDEISGAKEGTEDKPNIDVYHALWATNDKDNFFGSLWGYPRIAHAYYYWWSDRLNWLLSDRYTELRSIPPLVGYYPEEGILEDDSGVRYTNMEIIMQAMAQIRAGGYVALPSDVLETFDGTRVGGGMRKWEIKPLEVGDSNIDFDEKHNKMAVMKLRSLFVPEQAFLEGEGGTSSRNVASQMAEIFTESQTSLMAEIDDHINRFVIPQLVAINFPEYVGKVEKVSTGFSSDDLAFMKQVIQLVGQEDFTQLGVDVRAVMERLGVPMLSQAEIQRQQQELINQSAQTTPALTEPQPGQAGVVEDNSVAAGFSYVQPRDLIEVNLSANELFLADLPDTPHFSDRQVRTAALALRKAFASSYREQYNDFASYLDKLTAIELADDDSDIFSEDKALKLAKKIVDAWTMPVKALDKMKEAALRLLKVAARRSSDIESKKAKIKADVSDDSLDEWTNERVGQLITSVQGTVRDNLIAFVSSRIEAGVQPKQLAQEIKVHFSDFPDWQAQRVARTEIKMAYNVGTIMAARSAGIDKVQAHDASDGDDASTDKECQERHGKIFNLEKALVENEKEHPNGTLYFSVVPDAELSVQYVSDAEDMAWYDPESHTAYLSEDISREDESQYLLMLTEALRNDRDNN